MPVTQQSGSSYQTTQGSGVATASGSPETDPNYSESIYTSETSVYVGAVDGADDGLGAAVLADPTRMSASSRRFRRRSVGISQRHRAAQ